MKIAYLLTVHKNPAQVNLLMSQLLEDKDVDIYVHISGTGSITREKLIRHKNIHVLKDNIEVQWGGVGLTKAMILLLQAVIESGTEYSYVSFRTGQDLMIKEGFKDYIHNSADKLHMDFKLITENNPTYAHIAIIWPSFTRTLYDGIQPGRVIRSLLIKMYSLGFNMLPNSHRLINDYELYWGRLWFTIPYEVALYIIDFINKNQWYYDVFEKALAPDELFFQTIIMNSKYRESVTNDNLTYSGKYKNNHPEILSENDIAKLEESGDYFARKFDMDKDSKVLEYFANKIKDESRKNAFE